MDDDEIRERTARTATLYFDGYPWQRPYELWRSFDRDLARDLSLFVTGKLYARERLPHPTRQLVAIAALTALERRDELRMHLWAGLEVGLEPEEIAEAIFQVAVYGGMPVVNVALGTLREVLEARAARAPKDDEG